MRNKTGSSPKDEIQPSLLNTEERDEEHCEKITTRPTPRLPDGTVMQLLDRATTSISKSYITTQVYICQ